MNQRCIPKICVAEGCTVECGIAKIRVVEDGLLQIRSTKICVAEECVIQNNSAEEVANDVHKLQGIEATSITDDLLEL